MSAASLNVVYSRPSMRRRYEVWFVRFGLADGSGAWWFRYLRMNPGCSGCQGHPQGLPAEALAKAGQPVQVWATWFPRDGSPQSFIQGFAQDKLSLSAPSTGPFHLEIVGNRIDEDSCRGQLDVEGHRVAWNLRFRSTFAASVTEVGWIGFSRTPHSDAAFSGEIVFDGKRVSGEPLGYGLQGHNCGFRHRHLWNWTHCLFQRAGEISTFEALEYEIPLGRRVRRALLWHGGQLYRFSEFEELLRDRQNLRWVFKCFRPEDDTSVLAWIDGSGPSLHRLPYLKTDCSGTFEVSNNSLARATLYFLRSPSVALAKEGGPVGLSAVASAKAETLSTDSGAVLEMVGG